MPFMNKYMTPKTGITRLICRRKNLVAKNVEVFGMYKLSRLQAQRIVEKMMKDIPYNINIMDEQGIIIGSGQTERIGIVHAGAVEAIKLGVVVEINCDKKFEKKGINLPIKYDNEIVGVVGISGNSKEVRPFGNLVNSTVTLMIEQEISLQRLNEDSKKKNDFFRKLISPANEISEEFYNEGLEYKIDLNKETQVVIIEFKSEINGNPPILQYYPSFKTSSTSVCMIIQDNANLPSLKNHLQTKRGDVSASFGGVGISVSLAYLQAKSAMQVMKGLFPDKTSIKYSDVKLVADMTELKLEDKKISHILDNNEILIETLQVYIENNLNVMETADNLNIHRNTLNYRLNRIYEITGKDPKKILDLIELIHILINRKM